MRAAIVVGLFLWLSAPAFACFCVPPGSCPGLGGKSDPVFLGTVLAVADLAVKGDQFLSRRKARIRVDESFGGLSGDEHEVDVRTGAGGGDCGIPFRAGERYLVGAYRGDDWLLYVSVCGITQRIENAGVALGLLRKRRDGRGMPSLAGRIARFDRDFDGPRGTKAPKAIANALVRVKAGGDVYEARADAEGVFEFYNLPSGRYEFAPELPPGTALASYIGSDDPPGRFELSAGQCEKRDVEFFASGSIEGHIYDASNQLLPQAPVSIVPAQEKVIPRGDLLHRVSQDKRGFFRFVHIPPGEYLIVVNPDDLRDPGFPYRRTFYPDVHERAWAKIVAVHGGEQIKDVDIRLEQQFTPRYLSVRVQWADGRLVDQNVYILAQGTASPELKSDGGIDAKAQTADLTLVPSEPYEIHAELTCRYADEQSEGPGAELRSNPEYIGAGDGRTALTLTMPAIACPAIEGKTLVTDW